ncbi:MAG TPA: tRNA threonylcarbamoyladenosine dehydratase, partial [Bacteroidales bacterium]|nr:tRNA threonylcarbamoyladenosine dehydratase [Bacteroidales bacterium]
KPSNRNRQLIALTSTEGRLKAEVMAERLLDINPNINLHTITQYLKDDVLKEVVCQPYDYVADALDTLSPKLFLLIHSVNYGHKVISSMGAGSKIHPERIKAADISETNTCPLALLLRKRLKKHGITKGIKAVFSDEAIMEGSRKYMDDELNKKTIVGTISYMPAIFGLFMASVIIRDLTGTLPTAH